MIITSCGLLQVYHVLEGKVKRQLLFDDHLEEEHQPFPTLKHALAVLDPCVGFNIEIKWTMLLKVILFICAFQLEIQLMSQF